MAFSHLSGETLSQWLATQAEPAIVDIRDPDSFAAGHIPGSHRLDNSTVAGFVADTPADATVVVVCYHGHSSQQAAQWLVGQGFSEVYSLDGGFEQWRHQYPERTAAS
ncbi:thiosulfate sulfurtransferase GlpE [Larsenimonas rhizosphaerae]|uniref:Thiosulfate sulfurtransferase GlpE n=1 Tax=Larsenimonas rhizosphaerae TaxID=2944682 RepID=A0AA41ZCN0_9GAMM|nr:thiosulfate sulfurtransferase GlpE [Larsenimonas rhizosphaerae]MCX2522872.1 thiosulfate sulfurtransferase GlpE [Larsenimonas rhizosphaerae]